ncbi:MAG: type II toxin-antitoxin system RatA family toxin [Acidiferrobacterales bacterium]|nr:type II toxin-antitoxin system RatA family toxin [Acidiferrobacterales bacterium]
MNISRSSLLPYSARQMYDVVADILSYPGFLNWCDNSEIISECEQEVVAKLFITYSKLNFEFTTRNTNTPHESIKIALVDGPFNNLNGEWTFTPLSETACKVSIKMNFDFERSLAQRMLAKLFKNIVTSQLEAFQNRAKILYGTAND